MTSTAQKWVICARRGLEPWQPPSRSYSAGICAGEGSRCLLALSLRVLVVALHWWAAPGRFPTATTACRVRAGGLHRSQPAGCLGRHVVKDRNVFAQSARVVRHGAGAGFYVLPGGA